MKRFNTTGLCIPSKHYMVDLSGRVAEMRKMVEAGAYFVINRPRQYGKTTTLYAIQKALETDHIVLSISFQGISEQGFANESAFVYSVCRLIKKRMRRELVVPPSIRAQIEVFVETKGREADLGTFFDVLMEWCEEASQPLVLMIDEVDSASNNQVFLDFLAMLRTSYLERDAQGDPAFQSVILAGVADVRHLKGKIREEAQHRVNSPWNIAAEFRIPMELSVDGIAGMLGEYEADHGTGMDTRAVAEYIESYTSGYPFLVSRICQLLDERMVPERFTSLAEAWTEYGVDEAVKWLLLEDNALFGSLSGKLQNDPALKKHLRDVLLRGEKMDYLPDDETQTQLRMYGFLRKRDGRTVLANRIFEMRLYRQFVGEEKKGDAFRRSAEETMPAFVRDGRLDVPLILERFIKTYQQIHGDHTLKFAEEEGRERFLTYLAPIINGVGTYSIEEQTRSGQRMDVVIHYLGQRYVIELKIWRGSRYNEEGEKQILSYLEYFGLNVGYMLSFNFNEKKEPGVRQVRVGGKLLYEGTV